MWVLPPESCNVRSHLFRGPLTGIKWSTGLPYSIPFTGILSNLWVSFSADWHLFLKEHLLQNIKDLLGSWILVPFSRTLSRSLSIWCPGPVVLYLFFFSPLVMSDSMRPHGLQLARLPCLHDLPGLLKLMSIESMMPSNHLILCCPLVLLLSIFPSIRVFSSELFLCIRWPKYWSFKMVFYLFAS